MSTPTTFILGYGATLGAATTSVGTVTNIAQLKSISYSGDSAEYATVTNLGSPSAAAGGPPVAEYAPSMITPSTCTVTGILVPAGDTGQTLISASFATQTLLYFTHQFAPATGQTTGAKRTYSAYVSKKPVMDSTITDAVSFNFELKITGVTVDTPGTTSGS
jgi:acetoacetate decarboxylase